MKAIVTGATGFVGSHTVESLLSRQFDVVCPVRNTGSLRNLSAVPAKVVSLGALEAELETAEYFFHIAGATRGADYRDFFRSNVEFTRLILESAKRKCRNLKKFVLVSSQAAAGPSDRDGRAITESDPPRPISDYGRSKLEAERLVSGAAHELPVTILRPPTVFGPRDLDVLGVFKWARFGLAPYLCGQDRLVSIIYVEDLVSGIVEAGLSDAAIGRTYFLADPQPVIWREFTSMVADVGAGFGISIPVPVSALKMAALAGDAISKCGKLTLLRSEKFKEMRQIAWVCSPERAWNEFGWKSRVPAEAAIRKTFHWYKLHGLL